MHLVCACIDDHIFMAFIQCALFALFIYLLYFSVNPFDTIICVYIYYISLWCM